MLFGWLQRDAGSAPEGAGRALRGYMCLIRNRGNLKETAKSTDRKDGGKEGREPRRELNLLYFFYMLLPLREEIPMDFWPLSSKKKNSVMLVNNEL